MRNKDKLIEVEKLKKATDVRDKLNNDKKNARNIPDVERKEKKR